MILDGRKIRDRMIMEMKVTLDGKRVTFVAQRDNLVTDEFVLAKKRVADALGINTEVINYDATLSTGELVDIVKSVANCDGVVVQLPLPAGVDNEVVLDAVPTRLDIDMLSHTSRKLFLSAETERMPPVSRAVDIILKEGNVDLTGKKILVLGKGRLVGVPVMAYFDRLGLSYTARSIEDDSRETLLLLENADIVISGMGMPLYIKPEMIKDGVIIIDAGTSESGGRVVGDADPSCAEKATIFTPVPGGVGPIAVAALFENLSKNWSKVDK